VTEATLPFPPLELAHRVGSLAGASDPYQYYNRLGRETRDGIVNHLPPDWSFNGKRILDFGCGAGRTLRHFADEAASAEFWGCDIDEASIGWMEEQLCPPFHAFVNGAEPPLDQADASFDLIWAISVFTHLTSSWSQWLLELHRILKPDGLLLVTFMGEGMSEEIAGDPWDEANFGMNIIKYGQSWDLGGPMVLHSPWWIEEHWGRAFEIVSLRPDGFAEKPWLDHGTVLMRKRERQPTPEELESMTPGDERELGALSHNIEQLHLESLDLREGLEDLEGQKELVQAQASELNRIQDEAEALRAEATDLHRRTTVAEREAAVAKELSLVSAGRLLEVEETMAQARARIFALEEAIGELQPQLQRTQQILAAMKSSISWKLTSPLRALKRRR
jgi:SAM-dependent methyltransferase